MTTAEEPSGRALSTRAKLRRAALTEMSRRGFHGTTTRDIAASAGLSTAALYVHYPSKEALLYAISREGHDETLDVVRAAVASAERPSRQLARLMGDYAGYHAREHAKAVIINRELAALDAGHLEEILAIRHEIESVFEAVLRAGVDAGEFEIPDVKFSTIALLSLGLDIARWYRPTGTWSPEDVAIRYAEIGLRVVGYRGE